MYWYLLSVLWYGCDRIIVVYCMQIITRIDEMFWQPIFIVKVPQPFFYYKYQFFKYLSYNKS